MDYLALVHAEEMADYTAQRNATLAVLRPLPVSALRQLHIKIYGNKRLASGLSRANLIDEIIDATMEGL
jgi:hypothetical protein